MNRARCSQGSLRSQGDGGPAKHRPEATGGRSALSGEAISPVLKVASYNIHSCIDTRRRVNPENIARVIGATGAQVVALQEVDADKSRTGNLRQARWLGKRLGMRYLFYPVVRNGPEKYGLAILSSIPMKRVRFGRLPSPWSKRPREVRGVMWASLETPDGPVNVFNTHLGLRAAERRLQIDALLGSDWVGAVPEREPVVFCGDFNAGRRSYVYGRMCEKLSDVRGRCTGASGRRPTFLSFYPIFCIDHIFVSKHLIPRQVTVPFSALVRKASDHLPVVAHLALERK